MTAFPHPHGLAVLLNALPIAGRVVLFKPNGRTALGAELNGPRP
jgi:hypothetical protein